jgi:protein-disulfide isomerase
MKTGQGPKQLIIVTPDDKAVYMVMGDPLDASGSMTELVAARGKEQAARAEEIKKLAQNQPVRGNAAAPVTVVAFSDFQCPYCKRGADVVDQLLAKRPNDVKVVFLHYPLPFHPWATPAAVAAECAARQDPKTFWTLHDAYFKEQQAIDPSNVMKKSEQFLAGAGIDMKKWSACSTEGSPEYTEIQQAVAAEMQAGQKLGVEGTPAFFIEGELVSGAVPVEELERAVDKALTAKRG